jgi:hypothetical protein
MSRKDRINEAVEIVNFYRDENQGDIPVLVIAHGKEGRFVVVGKFRPDERGNGAKTLADQQQFVSIMRIVFADRGVKSYEVVSIPKVNNAALQLTQNLLSIFTVDAKGTYGEFFEIEEDKLTPCFPDMEIGSWFASMLPSEFEVEIDAKTQKRINAYIDACTYVVPEYAEADEDELTGIEALMAAF